MFHNCNLFKYYNYLLYIMLYLILKAQLGNQLFQIFNIISLSLEYNIDYRIYINNNEKTLFENKKTYFNNFLSNIQNKIVKIDKNSLNNNLSYYKEKKFSYDKIEITDIDKDIYIDGFFQSYKYFQKYYDQIDNIIKISNYQDKLNNKYSYIFQKKTISIHFRFGDYLTLQDLHPIQNIKYYIDSIIKLNNILKENNEFIIDYNLLYFCNSCDNEIVLNIINNLNNIFSNKLNFIKINDTINEYEQMLMISLTDHKIIANSTFSWFGAYLTKKNNIVIYPKKWFGNYYKDNDIKDLILDNWYGIGENI